MKQEVAVEWAGMEMSTITTLCETIRDVGTPVGLEWAGMVMEHWYEKNFSKIYNGAAPYKFKLRNYQALALRQLIMSVGLQSLLEDAIRNGIVANIDQQLPHRVLSLNH